MSMIKSRDEMGITGYYSADQDFETTLPPGTYYIGDPCYALSDGAYLRLVGETGVDGHNMVVKTGQGVMLVWKTPAGDGFYPCFVDLPNNFENSTLLAVDSGQLAIIDIRLTDTYDPNNLPRNWMDNQPFFGQFTVDQPYSISVESNGNVNNVDEDGPTMQITVTDDHDYEADMEDDEFEEE
jgi:hypothetical protein